MTGGRILVAEDNAMIGMLIQSDLEQAGFDVLGPFPRMAPALEAARTRGCALALVDIDLAGGDSGVSLAGALSGQLGVPCLFVTGQAIDAARGAEHALGVLSKPVPSEVMVQSVHAALRVAKGHPPPEISAVRWF